MNKDMESYSGFYNGVTASKKKESGLDTKLRDKGIKNIIVFGLATDYCVNATAQDGVDFDYNVYFVPELSRGVRPDTTQLKRKEMEDKGVKEMSLEELKKKIK